jgi:hypothetical protein
VNTPEISPGLLLADTIATIRYADKSRELSCKIYFSLKRHNTLLIEILELADEIFFGNDERTFWVSLPWVRSPVECYLASSTTEMTESTVTVSVKLAPRFSLIEVDHPLELIRVNTGVLNLGLYWTGFPGGLSTFKLSHENWIFDFTPVSDRTVCFDPRSQVEEFRFTHHVCMHKLTNELFPSVEAHGKLNDLAKFLSFCHGHWVSTALTSGIDENGIVAMEEWGTRQLSRWSEGSNWLDKLHGECMIELFPLFMKLISSSGAWKDAIDKTIYWYVRADTNLVGPDGACILLQATLERLAWHVLVRERQCLSKDGFSKLPAADQFRLLLTTLSIPLLLPSGLVALKNVAKELNWTDGPEAFVQIRNRIVHPPKSAAQEKHLPYYDAYRLAKWYVELAVLSACGYKGVYSNQTRESRWRGEVEPVPWAT